MLLTKVTSSKFLQEYTIEQKRSVFFKFADCFLDHSYAQELKAMVSAFFIFKSRESSVSKSVYFKITFNSVHRQLLYPSWFSLLFEALDF